jgi:integrase
MGGKRHAKRLTAREVDTLTKPGRHADGDGLYLVVRPGGSKQWMFLYRRQGRLREMGLGSPSAGITLAQARQLAAAARSHTTSGEDPLDARHEAAREIAKVPEFGSYALGLVDRIERGFSNPKHRQQWRNTLSTYCRPIWKLSIDAVDTRGVLACLTPIWHDKPETASRVRGRIERVLNAAKAEKLRAGENPAMWRGHLDSTLPRPAKLTRGHHAALPYTEVKAFVAELRARVAVTANALEFLILTAARTSEVLNAEWNEFDLATSIWTIPGKRMKARVEHRVPLSKRATEIIAHLDKSRVGDFVFAGQRLKRPLSNTSLLMLLRRMKRGSITAHGFRSAFSDWASEVSPFSSELRETALAHTISNKAERAYRRGDALEKRRAIMEAWAAFCAPNYRSQQTKTDRSNDSTN